MCSPTAATGIGLQAVSSIFATKAARDQAVRDQNANNKLVNETRLSATENTRRALQDLDARQLEEMLAAANQQDQNTRAGNVSKSTAIVAAGEAGVTGNSVDELLNDVVNQTGRNRMATNTNSDITQAQLVRNREATVAGGLSEFNSVQPKKFNKPSYLAGILGIAPAAIGAVDSYQDQQARLKTPAATP